MINENQKKVLRALNNPKCKWRSIPSISKETGLGLDAVRRIIAEIKAGKIIKARGRGGNAYYTTREHFRAKASFWEKLRGGFRNRIR